jgi:alkylhydroperoxidase/carboxymuconolactone decarboxylase family protein YurZ/pimeloyl-ACP methyl ester carboxylesterase
MNRPATTAAPSASDVLSIKQQAIPSIAYFMAASNLPRLNSALNQGLDAGLTISEEKEILVQLYAYVGFPRSLNALGELMKVVEARKQRGIQDSPGREPSRPVPTGDELLAVGTANQTRISGVPVQGPVFTFAPIINQFLRVHLFGDIFERDNLDWQSRELATVGALTATPGAEPQLRSHMAASARVGLTDGQLRQLTRLLADCRTAENGTLAPLVLQSQGSFEAGGSVVTAPGIFDPHKPLEPAGQTYHGDHAYAFYQIPVNPRKLPIVMLHGAGQFSKSWETTADGREGFQTLFLRRRYGVYLLDQPRRGNAGRSLVETTLKPTPDEQLWFNQFRLGLWPRYFEGVQFSRDPETLNQFFRSMTPNTGPFDLEVVADGASAVFKRIGPGLLFTHSQGGGSGWLIAIKNSNVKAIVAFEPGSSFVFPEGEVPPPIPSAFDTVQGAAVPMTQFTALTKIPILVFYGDNIPAEPVSLPAQDSWRARLKMARLWRDAVNKHGGDVTLVHLPEIGIKGNTHFIFSDLNNVQIADLVSKFLAEKGLD